MRATRFVGVYYGAVFAAIGYIIAFVYGVFSKPPWDSWMVNWKSIGFFSIILTFLMIVWARVSVVIFALFASHDYPNLFRGLCIQMQAQTMKW